MGFAHTDDGDKLLNVRLTGYTPDMSANMPFDASVFAWRQRDAGNHVRLVSKTNLSGTATDALETVAIKLSYLKDIGVRADAAATGGDVPQGQLFTVSTCVPPDLDQSQGVVSSGLCSGSSSCAVSVGTRSAASNDVVWRLMMALLSAYPLAIAWKSFFDQRGDN